MRPNDLRIRIRRLRRCLLGWWITSSVLLVTGAALGQAPIAWPEVTPPPSGRIVVVEAPGATVQFAPRLDVVSNMVARGLTTLTGYATPREAWLSLLSTQETVGIKVFSRPGAISGTRPPVVEAVVQSLLQAGLPPTNIIVWDHHLADLRLAGFLELSRRYGIRVAGSAEAGYDPEIAYETPLIGTLVWGDLEFGQTGPSVGRRSFASRLVTRDMGKIISIAPLLNNNQTAVSGHCWGTAIASVDNTLRFESTPGRLAEAVPELLALERLDLRDRLILSVTDAMLCQYQGEERQLLHYSTILDQLWFSQDPVALDVLGVAEIERQRTARDLPGRSPSLVLYENASLLELGISDTNAMDITRVALPRTAPSMEMDSSATPRPPTF